MPGVIGPADPDLATPQLRNDAAPGLAPTLVPVKRLLRFVVLIALAAAIAWATRQYMLPKPPPPLAEPPPFRPPHEPPAPEVDDAGTLRSIQEGEPRSQADDAEADDLKVIKGIGPVYEARLADLRVTTFVQLVAADSHHVADELDVNVAAVVDWKTQAAAYVN